MIGTHNPAEWEVVSQTDRHGQPLRTVMCPRTGLVFNDPVPTDAELAEFYADRYRTAYKGAAKPRARQILRNFRRVAGQIRQFRDVFGAAERVLDVGAGSGEFVFLMQSLGGQVQGVEPNKGYSAYCRDSLGLDVQTAHIAPGLFAPGTFDLVRLNHVLEHLNDPVDALAMLASWLKPDGVFFVEVPNIEGYCQVKSPGNMFHYGHIWNFNPWTLRAVAGLAGLEELEATRDLSAGTTSVCFRKGPVRDAATFTNEANAAVVREAIRRHYAGEFRENRVAKPVRKLSWRLEETITGFLAGTPKAIGEKVARTLRD